MERAMADLSNRRADFTFARWRLETDVHRNLPKQPLPFGEPLTDRLEKRIEAVMAWAERLPERVRARAA
jgi:hypothetical protein